METHIVSNPFYVLSWDQQGNPLVWVTACLDLVQAVKLMTHKTETKDFYRMSIPALGVSS